MQTAEPQALIGTSKIRLNMGDEYVEYGATAADACDQNADVMVGGEIVDTSVPGVYVVTYDAEDNSGNRAETIERTVMVGASHPADLNSDFRVVLEEALLYVYGWQQGNTSIFYALRAVYIWQNGEYYVIDLGQECPLCWVLE